CLDSYKYREEVRKDTADGRSAGMNGTPTTFINGRMVVGALPFSEFEQIIEQELAK
ncbi:MAG: DsbA family protein, partial [Patescibacteria group bacterium]